MILKITDARGWTSYYNADSVTRLGYDREILEGSDHLHELSWVDVDEDGNETQGCTAKWSPKLALARTATPYGEGGLGILAESEGQPKMVPAITLEREDGSSCKWAEAGVLLHEYLGLNVELIDAEAIDRRTFLSGMLFVLVVDGQDRRVLGFVPSGGAWLMSDTGKTLDSLLT